MRGLNLSYSGIRVASLFEYVAVVRLVSREEFLQKQPATFLLVNIEGRAEGRDRSFKTSTISGTTAALAKAMATGAVKLSSQVGRFEVLPIVKGKDSPWAGRISIGRARNNDIVVDEASVSKMHAHFEQEGADLAVTDAQSHNGVTVNGEKLVGGGRRTLKVGDALLLGAVVATYVDAGALYDFIKKDVLQEVVR